MSHFKTFLLGIGVAYGVYFITRKRVNGYSILDELLESPEVFFERAKNQAITDIVQTVKQNVS